MRQRVWPSLLLLVPALLLLVALTACGSDAPTSNAPVNSGNVPVNSANAPNVNAASNANGGSDAKEGAQSPLAGIVRASADSVEVRAGETAQGAVRLTIGEGYHVNANPATEKFLIPTTLEVKTDAGITADKITYPKALKKKFPFAKIPVAVYEGETRITLMIRAPQDAAPGQHTLAARLNVQPCDDEKCYPPTTVQTSIPVNIR